MTESASHPDGRIVTAREGDLFLIGLRRPEKYNGFTPKMLRELGEAFTAYERDDGARCAVLYGEGKHFTAGLELSKVAPMFERGEPMMPKGLIDPINLVPPLRSKPVVAAVQGICFTIGIELMLAQDIVVAARDCRFAQMEVRRGIMPTGGATLRMVERAGWSNGMRWLLTGGEFDAETALRLGFVQEVVEPGEQLERAKAIAREVAAQAPLAVRATIASSRKSLLEGFEAAVAELDEVQRRLMRSADAREGVQSFIERRPARFEGR